MLGYFLDKISFGELYKLEVIKNGFAFKLTETLYRFLVENLITREEVLLAFQKIPMTKIKGGLVRLDIILPFISFPNYAHKRTDWEVLRECAQRMQLIFMVFNYSFKNENTTGFSLSENKPLMAIETGYREDTHFHACWIGVGFSKIAREALSEKFLNGVNIPSCERVAFDFYFGLSSSSKREMERNGVLYKKYGGSFNSINASVREGGTPHFIVPGNCACLGANPDEFKREGDMYSHNLDTPLQQMAMLASVVSFWNEVLTPLCNSKK